MEVTIKRTTNRSQNRETEMGRDMGGRNACCRMNKKIKIVWWARSAEIRRKQKIDMLAEFSDLKKCVLPVSTVKLCHKML